jgi:glycosyltransferase Alg8
MFIAYYAVWVGFTRWIMSLMLLSARPVLSWYYPFLIYYNQIWGALIKTYVFFRLDRQSWTRQKTRLERGLTQDEQRMISFSSSAVHTVAIMCFVAIIGTLCGVFSFSL